MVAFLRAGLVALLATAAACASGEPRPSSIEPSGPPAIEGDVVATHARQFDNELADREAGSQSEQAASQYILGHLQRAGYVVRLEAVPVGDLVESTDLVALPPSGEDPSRIVTVAFDAAPQERSGAWIGLFLELARALYAADRDHAVGFAALGADRTDELLGSRRLAQLLLEEERSPHMISLVEIAPAEPVTVAGSGDQEIQSVAAEESVRITTADVRDLIDVDVFARAGFEHTIVAGDPERVGRVLLAYLASSGE